MIQDDILDALSPAFPGTTVIHANENGPRPPGVYVAFRIEQAHDMPAHTGATTAPDPIPAFGAREIAAHRTGTIEVQCYGVGSYDLLESGMLRLAGLVAMDAADAAGIVFGVVQDLQNVPALRNESQWEPRAVCSLPFAYTRRVTEAVPVIETVEGTIEIDGLPDMPFEASIA